MEHSILHKKIIIILILFILITIFTNKLLVNNKGVLISFIFTTIIIYLYYNKLKLPEEIEEKKVEIKKQYLIPRTTLNDTENIDFLFSVQEFYEYNPIAYQNFSRSLDNFYLVKKDILTKNSNIFQNWDLLEKYKKDALNNLNSIIFELPNNNDYEIKHAKKILELEEMLAKEQEKLYKIYKEEIKNRNWNSKEITIGPKPYNNIESKLYTFDFFQ